MRTFKWLSAALIAGFLFISSASASYVDTISITGPGQTFETHKVHGSLTEIDEYFNLTSSVDIGIVGGLVHNEIFELEVRVYEGLDVTDYDAVDPIAQFFGSVEVHEFLSTGDKYTIRITGLASIEGGDYQLTVSSAPVPLPAAFWLFGSALVGFIGLGRRKKA